MAESSSTSLAARTDSSSVPDAGDRTPPTRSQAEGGLAITSSILEMTARRGVAGINVAYNTIEPVGGSASVTGSGGGRSGSIPACGSCPARRSTSG